MDVNTSSKVLTCQVHLKQLLKAANAGGVAVSALEMSQNSMRYNWTSEEVDEKLHNIMKSIFNNSVAAAEKYGLGFDLIKGANIAGFEKVVEAMISQGIY